MLEKARFNVCVIALLLGVLFAAGTMALYAPAYADEALVATDSEALADGSVNALSTQGDTATLPLAAYNMYTSLIKYSSLAPTSSGYVRVFIAKDGDANQLYAETYDDEFALKSRIKLNMELSYYGGFYNGTDAYYLVFGQSNTAEKDGAEVIRVVKYTKAWKRVGAASLVSDPDLWGAEVRYPFDAGNVEIAERGDMLYLVTGHEGYVDPAYNQGHQGFIMYAIDKSTMKGSVIDADLWHSFSQHITLSSDGELYVLEESEGSRFTKISKVDPESGRYGAIPVLEYGGSRDSAWAIATYASADALAVSSSNVMAVGQSIDQSRYDDDTYKKSYNIYLTVTPRSNFTEEATKVKWITTDNTTDGYRGIKLVRVNDNRFLLMWERDDEVKDAPPAGSYDSMSAHVLHYLFLDGSGNIIGGKRYTAAAAISEVNPVIKDGKAVFYASDGASLAFYTINTANGDFSKKNYQLAGEEATWTLSGSTLTISGKGTVFANFSTNGLSAIASKVKKVVVGNGITGIGDSAFSGMSALEEVRLSRGVKTIGDSAFYGIRGLKIYVPDSVTSIADNAFNTGSYWISSHKPVIAAMMYCTSKSYAAQYAKKIGVAYESPTVTLADAKASYTGKAISAAQAKTTITTGKVSYAYYTDKACTKKTSAAQGANKAGAAPKNAGTYYVMASAAADDVFDVISSSAAQLSISKAKNPLTVKAKAKTVKFSKLKKKAQKVSPLKVKKAQGKKSFKVTKWTTKKAKKYFSVKKSTGKVTVKKGTPKGTYKFKVKVTAKKSTNYKAGSKTVTVKIKVA